VEKFGELLYETMNDTLRRIFGESASELISRLTEKYGFLKPEEISEKNEAFYDYLERLLGLEGAQIVRNLSVKRLYFKLQREYEDTEKYFTLLDELYEIKFKLLTFSPKEESTVCN
jgi:hypothetical protein